jgi:hypothetical protein
VVCIRGVHKIKPWEVEMLPSCARTRVATYLHKVTRKAAAREAAAAYLYGTVVAMAELANRNIHPFRAITIPLTLFQSPWARPESGEA